MCYVSMTNSISVPSIPQRPVGVAAIITTNLAIVTHDCIYTLPGPERVVEKQPSPPKQQVQKLPLKTHPSLAESSKPTTLPESIVIVSPALRSLKTRVPPAFTKAMLPSEPESFCRQNPRPAPHQVTQLQSRLHPTSTSPSSVMYAPAFAIKLLPDATWVPNLMGIT